MIGKTEPILTFASNLPGSDDNKNWPPSSKMVSLPEFLALVEANPDLKSGPGSIAWRINGEKIMLLGWGCALLMQVAHPAIAAGVAEHSHFATSAGAKLARFRHTLDRILEMSFGTPEEAWKAARQIDNVHARVNGPLPGGEGHYSARLPELLKWVNASFIHTMLKTYELFVGPLTLPEKDHYVRQSAIAAPLLGAPYGYFSNNLAELEAYLDETYRSGVLEINRQTRKLARYILEGLDYPVIGPGLNWYGRLVTVGLLHPALRRAYGLKWSRANETTLKSIAWSYRLLRPTLPESTRLWECALTAEKRYLKAS